MTKHTYLPVTITSDKGLVFLSQVIKEVAEVLGVTIQHATKKHAETIGMLERTHASLMKTLKIETAERRCMRHKYVNLAVSNNNTSYLTSIGCEPSRVFDGRVPYNLLVLKRASIRKRHPHQSHNSQIAGVVFNQTEIIFQAVHKNIMQAYNMYKAYYDKKANASKLIEQHFIELLHPKADHQGNKTHFTDIRWIGPYIFENILPKNEFFGTQSGNEHNLSPSSHETPTGNAWTTHTRRKNNVTRKETWP